MEKNKSIFIVWKNFQRRVEVLAPFLELEIRYFHYSWEEKSKILKVLSYFLKSIATLACLFHERPALVFVQFPPTPALYCAALYARLTGARYVSDCHSSLTEGHWSNWPLAKKLLSRGVVIVHNVHIAGQVEERMRLTPFVLRDGIAHLPSTGLKPTQILSDLHLAPKGYVLLPWTFSPDEPIIETFEAARMIPDVEFVMTWYFERLAVDLRKQLPPNVRLTGYLPADDFNQLFSSAGVALILTKWEATQLSGMQEAMAFGIPAVVSDLKTTRYLYKDAPVYVKNEPGPIAEGIRQAFQNRAGYEKKIEALRIATEQEFSDQITELKKSLDLQG